jgi:hypothetical protein
MAHQMRSLRFLAVPVLIALGAPAMADPSAIRGLNTWLLGSLPQTLGLVSELGVSTVRVDLPWEQAEPARGQFDWRKVDQVVAAARSANIQVLFTLRSISSWGTIRKADRNDLYHHATHPKSMADWQQFVTSLAGRYRGQGIHYEIENEVNSDFWSGSLADYLDLLKASYALIKATDPQALVLHSAMACGVTFNPKTPSARQKLAAHHDDWLRPILATGAFDVINVHDYYFPLGPEVNGWNFESYLDRTLTLVQEAGIHDKPVWITELGYIGRPVTTNGRADDATPDQQATRLTEAYRQAAARGVERAFWLFLRDAPNAGYFGPMGLRGADDVPHPAWRAYQAIGGPQGL